MRCTPSKPCHDFGNEFGLACPRCGHADTLVIVITCSATLTIDGTEAHGDHDWDETSPCRCDACDHLGTVGDFADKAVRS